MAIKVSTIGIYQGVKQGIKRDGQPWYALTFKVPEVYKGTEISPEQMQKPNLNIFPPDGMDINSQFNPGQKYNLVISVGSAKSGYPNYDYVGHKAVS